MSNDDISQGAAQHGTQPEAGRPLVSLVVPTYNRTDVLVPMFEALIRQTERRFEVIVVDQNQDDRLVPLLAPLHAEGIEVIHVRLPKPGLSPARNAGLARARGKIVAFPDDDCWYEPGVVAAAVAHFTANPQVAAIVGHWVEQDPEGKRPAETLSAAAFRRYKGGSVACFVLFFATDTLQKVGGFNPNLGIGSYYSSGEEEDLTLRLLTAGARIDYVPAVRIHHFFADAPRLDANQRARNRKYGRGMGAVLAKHRFPLWIVGRGLVGPLYHALNAPNKAESLILAAYTSLGRAEGWVSWQLGLQGYERKRPAGHS